MKIPTIFTNLFILSCLFLCSFSSIQAQDIPNIEVLDMDGKKVMVSSLKNPTGPLMLYFWGNGSWCYPCLQDLAVIHKEYPRLKSQYGLKIVIINVGTKETVSDVAKLVSDSAWTFESYKDLNGKLFTDYYKQNVAPYMVFYNKDGFSILDYHDGAARWYGIGSFEEKVLEYIQGDIEYYNLHMERCTKQNAVYYRKKTWNSILKQFDIKDYYISDKIRRVAAYKSFVPAIPIGKIISYFENGNIEVEAVYNEYGLKNGLSTTYYENGTKKYVSTYINGLLEGVYKEFDASGKLIKISYCVGGDFFSPASKMLTETNLEELLSQNNTWVSKFEYSDDIYLQGNILNKKKTGNWVCYYLEGKIKYEGQYTNGQLSGYWKNYHENGNIASEGIYNGGIDNNSNTWKRIGIWKKYYKDGQLYSIEEYNSTSKLTGVAKYYYSNGTIQYLINYDNGLLSGDYFNFYDNGKINHEGKFLKNVSLDTSYRVGVWKYYYDDGALGRKEQYSADGRKQGLEEAYFPDGKLNEVLNFKNGLLSGEYKIYYRNGALKEVGFLIITADSQNVFSGIKKKYYENSQLNSVGFYDTKGLLNGEFIEYFENGQISYKANYFNGKVTGECVIYYDNGQVKVVANYKDDLLINVKSKYAKDGKLLDSGTVQNGTGTSKVYDDYGKLIKLKMYKDGVVTEEIKIN